MTRSLLILQAVWAIWFGTTFGMQQAELEKARYYAGMTLTELCNERVHGNI